MLNLLLNAIQAMPESKGQIRIATDNITIPTLPRRQSTTPNLPPGNYVYFQISDTGVGMNQELLNQIFEPYFTTKVSGMGLGLTAALRIVQAHRGITLVWSAPGVGSTFLSCCRHQRRLTTDGCAAQSLNRPLIDESNRHDT